MRRKAERISMRILIFSAILLCGCDIPCEWISDDVCEPFPGEQLSGDADVIGDSDVSVQEIPPELQRCVQGIVPTWTGICEHRGGEPGRVCAYGPKGEVCHDVNEPIQFRVEQCVPGVSAPRAVYTCDTCDQDLSQAFEERTPEALRTALSVAPICSNPQPLHVPNVQSCSRATLPLLAANYCSRTMPQSCAGKWRQISVCYSRAWVPACICTP